MITEAFISFLFFTLDFFLGYLPNVSWGLTGDMFYPILETLRLAFYILPMDAIVHIVGMVIILNMFRIVVSLVRTLWDLLPFA